MTVLCLFLVLLCKVLIVLSNFAFISLRKRELVALLNCPPEVFCVFSSRYHSLVSMCDYDSFLVMLTYFFKDMNIESRGQ